MKPYIEYNNERIEFEANFKLQKEFRKEYQNIIKKENNIIDNLDLEELNEISKEMEDLKKQSKLLKEQDIDKLTFELLRKHPNLKKAININQSEKLEELNEKYCKKIINEKYPHINYDELAKEIVCDKGFDYYYALLDAIIKTVFSSVVRVTPLQKHSFDWEVKEN